MSLGELERGNDWKSRLYYKALSLLSGQELAETERQKLRKHRKETLEKYEEIGLKGDTLLHQDALDVVIDMGLKEAQLMDSFEPDLLIMTKQQYKMLFDIPAGVGIEPQFTPLQGQQSFTPPMTHSTDAGEIEVTYSDSAKGMLLVESDSL